MLTESEIERLRNVIAATIASPVVGAIEDYAWEAMFHYVKQIPLSDPALGRSKLLYDAVDTTTATGWSLKSLQLSNLIGTTFLFVIQRAEIVKKRVQLGFPELTEQSDPAELGAAIIQHWNEKILSSQATQQVVNSYEGILLKTIRGNEYVYCEFPLEPLNPDAFFWAWTVVRKTGSIGAGLQGSVAGNVQLVWYKNQKQLFRARAIPAEAIRITVDRNRLTLDCYVETVLSALQIQLTRRLSQENSEE